MGCCFRNPAGARNFCFPKYPHCHWGTPSLVFTVHCGYFLDAKRPGREVGPHVVPGLRLSIRPHSMDRDKCFYMKKHEMWTSWCNYIGPSTFTDVDIVLYAYVVQCLQVIIVPLSWNQFLLLNGTSSTICCPVSCLPVAYPGILFCGVQ